MTQIATILLLIAVLFALPACQTQAQKTVQAIQKETAATEADANSCLQAARSDQSVQRLWKKLPRKSAPTVTQLADTTYANEKDRQALLAYSARLKPCREIIVKGIGNSLPLVVPIYLKYFSSTDEIFANLINKKVNWGDANRQLRSALNTAQEAEGRVMAMYQQNLNQAHALELQQRQARAAAFQNWAHQQQVLNSLNRTKTTNCNYIGNTINCTTY